MRYKLSGICSLVLILLCLVLRSAECSEKETTVEKPKDDTK
ncbi:unnamed protein product, partial [Allacma fusca]